jgi:hypothetical protein
MLPPVQNQSAPVLPPVQNQSAPVLPPVKSDYDVAVAKLRAQAADAKGKDPAKVKAMLDEEILKLKK